MQPEFHYVVTFKDGTSRRAMVTHETADLARLFFENAVLERDDVAFYYPINQQRSN